MFQTTLASLRAHKARLALSSLAIILGVAFVAGTFVFTGAIKNAFLSGFAADTGKADVVVTKQDQSTMSQDVLTAVRGVEGVAHAAGRISGRTNGLLDSNGRLVPGSEGAAIVSVPKEAELQWQDVAQGELPDKQGEAVLDLGTAEHTSLGLGKRVRIRAPEPSSGTDEPTETRSLRIVGLVDLGNSPQYASTPFVGTTVGQAAVLTGDHRFTTVLGIGAEGVAAPELAARVQHEVGSSVVARTGDEQAAAETKDLTGGMTAVTLALLAFAGIAMFVAAIVIANTFSILLAQRTRELALLRCVGATRSQVFRSVLLESSALGLTGSIAGVAAGYGLATGIGATLHATLENFPFAPTPPAPIGIALPIVIGVVVTVAAAFFPARGATRIPPVAALRERTESPSRRAGKVRLIFAGLALCGGAAGLAAGTFTPLPLFQLPVVGFVVAFLGGLAAFIGVLLAGPILVPPAIRLAGALPARVFGTTGRLATANAVRNPRRASATTSALLVGATLISLMTVGAASVKESMTSALDMQYPVDYMIGADGTDGVPEGVTRKVRSVHGIDETAVIRQHRGKLGSASVLIHGVDPGKVNAVAPSLGSSFGELDRGEVLLAEGLARRLDVREGDPVSLAGGSGRGTAVTVGAVVPDLGGSFGEAVLPASQFQHIFPNAPVGTLMASQKEGADAADVSAAVDQAAAAAPNLSVSGAAQVKASMTRVLDAMLLIVTALLGVAVLIALVGIANTLSLSVIERTRESGLLRALGLTRRQMRGTLAGEAVLIGLVGGLLGAGLGIVFGFAGAASLLPVDNVALVVPVGRIAGLVGVAVLAALLASVLPGRRAARASIVSALAEE